MKQPARWWEIGSDAACALRHAASAALVIALVAGSASAQLGALGGGLPCEVAARQSIDGAAEQQIRSFIEPHASKLTASDRAQVKEAREALLEPLACNGVSVAFRLKYAEAMERVLTPLAKGNDEFVAVNALRIAGRLRAGISLPTLEAGLAHASPVVRYGAAAALRDLLTQLAADQAGFPENSIDRAMDRLASTLAAEPDALVGDGLVLALASGPEQNAAMRVKGAERYTAALETRLKALRAGPAAAATAWSDAAYRALDASRLTILEQIAAGQTDRALLQRTALLGGQALALARDGAAGASESQKATLSRLVAAAESAMVIAHNALTGQKVGERGLQRAFDEGGSAFGNAINAWTGADGLLLKAPYNANAADFAPRA